MTSLRQTAVVLGLADSLRAIGNSCGHSFKGVDFLKELTQVPLDFEYVLYRHGPFSFDLRDALSAMRADDMISVTPQFQYGVTIEPTPFGVARSATASRRLSPVIVMRLRSCPSIWRRGRDGP